MIHLMMAAVNDLMEVFIARKKLALQAERGEDLEVVEVGKVALPSHIVDHLEHSGAMPVLRYGRRMYRQLGTLGVKEEDC